MEFWPHSLKQWNPVAILIIIAILNLSFHSNHCNSDPTPPALFLNTLEFLSYPSKQWDSGPILCTLAFWPYLYTHWNPNLILLSIGILALFCYILEFGSHPYKHWTSSRIFINIGILTLFFQTLEFWPLFINIGILIESIHTLEFWPCFLRTGIFSSFFPAFEFWPCSYKHCNSYLILSLQTLKFWSYPSKQWNFGPIFIYTGFLILTFKILGFWPYFYQHWNYDLMLPKNGILTLYF